MKEMESVMPIAGLGKGNIPGTWRSSAKALRWECSATWGI